ncbi:hypothetical protein B0H17DRAFT_1063869 [Mycena rosella]|uniref:Uncharacterized protein n=1 Tax=Mycena rosella TaxID=1033263 RepID=A0AAD7DHJ4_MYCRO|nr:hypothetical protein B0H17DRAFT_1063869 [Mycena rosella]
MIVERDTGGRKTTRSVRGKYVGHARGRGSEDVRGWELAGKEAEGGAQVRRGGDVDAPLIVLERAERIGGSRLLSRSPCSDLRTLRPRDGNRRAGWVARRRGSRGPGGSVPESKETDEVEVGAHGRRGAAGDTAFFACTPSRVVVSGHRWRRGRDNGARALG